MRYAESTLAQIIQHNAEQPHRGDRNPFEFAERVLRNNPEFQRLLASLRGQAGPAVPGSTAPSR